MYAVYFCHYGDYQAVPFNRLEKLVDNKFVGLPYQATKAKLHGNLKKLLFTLKFF